MVDGDMEIGLMGIMVSKFGSFIVVYSYLVFVLFYVFCVIVMGVIVWESSKGWMVFLVFWGLNVVYLLVIFCYQVVIFVVYFECSVLIIVVVLFFNLILMICLCLFGCEQVL